MAFMMRTSFVPKMLSKTFIDDSKTLNCIEGNGAFRALTFVSLCRLHFWSDCNKISGAFEILRIVKILFLKKVQVSECFSVRHTKLFTCTQ